MNEIRIGTPETENNLPIDADMTHDTNGDLSDMMGRRLPIISFWIGFIILALGWTIPTWQLKDVEIHIPTNQTVLTDNHPILIKGSIMVVHIQMAHLQDLTVRTDKARTKQKTNRKQTL